MIAQKVNELVKLDLKTANEISMKIARELIKDGFDMKDLADVQIRIMDLAKFRMFELGSRFDKEEDFIFLSALVV